MGNTRTSASMSSRTAPRGGDLVLSLILKIEWDEFGGRGCWADLQLEEFPCWVPGGRL